MITKKYYMKFVPFNGDKFFHLCADGDIMEKTFEDDDPYHQAMLHWRNCFETADKAKEAREASRELFEKVNITEMKRREESTDERA
jgi:hypothetical protein